MGGPGYWPLGLEGTKTLELVLMESIPPPATPLFIGEHSEL